MREEINGICVQKSDLEMHGDFIRRHIGPSRSDIEAMLEIVGYKTLDALINDAVPETIVSERTRSLRRAA